MVHSSARRQGLGARLIAEAEDAARARGRWLLVLDTVPGSDAERLYRRHGWIEVGRRPDYGFSPTVIQHRPSLLQAALLDAARLAGGAVVIDSWSETEPVLLTGDDLTVDDVR